MQARIPSPSSGAISDFSSYGPDVDLSFKPDVAAPGSLLVRVCTRHTQLYAHRTLMLACGAHVLVAASAHMPLHLVATNVHASNDLHLNLYAAFRFVSSCLSFRPAQALLHLEVAHADSPI